MTQQHIVRMRPRAYYTKFAILAILCGTCGLWALTSIAFTDNRPRPKRSIEIWHGGKLAGETRPFESKPLADRSPREVSSADETVQGASPESDGSRVPVVDHDKASGIGSAAEDRQTGLGIRQYRRRVPTLEHTLNGSGRTTGQTNGSGHTVPTGSDPVRSEVQIPIEPDPKWPPAEVPSGPLSSDGTPHEPETDGTPHEPESASHPTGSYGQTSADSATPPAPPLPTGGDAGRGTAETWKTEQGGHPNQSASDSRQRRMPNRSDAVGPGNVGSTGFQSNSWTWSAVLINLVTVFAAVLLSVIVAVLAAKRILRGYFDESEIAFRVELLGDGADGVPGLSAGAFQLAGDRIVATNGAPHGSEAARQGAAVEFSPQMTLVNESWTGQKQAEEEDLRQKEASILTSIFEQNVQLRQRLENTAA